MQIIKKEIINILYLKSKSNLEITCELYEIFNKLSIKCFNDDTYKQSLCYDQLCIYLDSINDNMRDITLIKNLTCIIYDSGLCELQYED